MRYTFLLRYRLPQDAGDVDEVVERLGAAGGDDALVGIGVPGRLALEFARSGDSAEAVLLSATRDVRKAVPQAVLVEIEPDLVGLTDAARLLGVSRQNLHKLRKTHPETFPSPVHEGSTAIWHFEDLLSWLKAFQCYKVPAALEELAATTKQFNLGRRVRERSGDTAHSAP
jgi:predicted DNA-binding transcriptional regulator AlpA